MRIKILVIFAIVLLGLTASGCNRVPVDAFAKDTKPKKTMRAFKSDHELRKYLKELAKKQIRGIGGGGGGESAIQSNIDTAGATGLFTAYDANSITNVQHLGVDEGGIVKLRGNHLVVLRRGRLFTIEVGDQTLKPVSVIDAYAPDIDPQNTWYDELLIADNTIIVIGFSYERGGTEVGLFNIDDKGNLSYRSTYHLRSNDYFSSRNYASRIVSGKLIVYSPLNIWPGEKNPLEDLPALRKWQKGATEADFRSIVSPTKIYRPEYKFLGGSSMALHTVTVCDPTGGELRCEATSVIGPYGHSFYVSPQSVYVWSTDTSLEDEITKVQSLLYRMPLDGSAPSAVKVSGGPVDQFSFLESADNYLNVLVREHSSGDGMWESEAASGEASLLRVSLASFSDGGEAVSPSNYRKLPTPEGYFFQNRFVSDYLLYGIGAGYEAPEKPTEFAIYAIRWSGGDPIKLTLTHHVDRIEAMGSAAVIVGTAKNELHFSAVSLGNVPKVENDYVRKDVSQGELRSHGFFYKANGLDSGVLGLPILERGRPGNGHSFAPSASASILYLRNNSLQFEEVGNLTANAKTVAGDNCRASCVDWYGQSRPLFLRDRVFALLGYELVEGSITGGQIKELRRLNYAPKLS